MIRTLDAADLVSVAAAATERDPDDVVSNCDVAVLTAIAGRAAACPSVVGAAAETMVGVAASRPFSIGNEAAAWLAAAHVLALNGVVVVGETDDVVELVRGAASGALDELAASTALARITQRAPGAFDRLIRWLFVVRPGTMTVRLRTLGCPACGRDVIFPTFTGRVVGVPTTSERIAVCARHNRTHGRDGLPIPGRTPLDQPPLAALSSELDRLRVQLALM